MIPKKIHYCWFGGNQLPTLVEKSIESWRKYCPDYEIVEWNESNFDLNCCDYVKEAYECKKWAFVSDYARLWIIYHHGGVYLDTDVELIKSLDNLLDEKCFFGEETSGFVATGLGFGAENMSPIIKLLMDEYDDRHFKSSNGVYDMTPCPRRNTEPLTKLGYSYCDNRIQRVGGAVILPPEYLCPMDYQTGKVVITDNTYSIHHYSATWISKEDIENAKTIQTILQNNGKIIGQLKKQYFLYKLQKNKGNTSSFWSYIFSKIKLKSKL